MGGRGGRGGGRGMSFSLDQVGIARGDALPAPVHTPPPHYPLLEHYPAIMAPAPRHHAMLSYRSNLLQHFSRYSDNLRISGSDPRRSVEQSDSAAAELKLEFDWSRFPYELRPTTVRKRKNTSKANSSKEKMPKVKNLDALLDELEKKEEVTVKKELDEDEEPGQNEDDEEMEDEDEEMDEGTDYNQNYFDNGEGFLDEDEDGDDSPVY